MTARTRRLHAARLRELEQARDALVSARAAHADPWRVTELQLAYDRLQERALETEFDDDLGEPMRGPARPWPLAPERRRGQ